MIEPASTRPAAGAILALAVPLAWLLDARFGEPANAWHPVAWIGRLLTGLGRRLRGRPPMPAFIGGALAWLVPAIALVIGAAMLQAALLGAPPLLAVPLLALALKPTFAWRMLRDEVAAVESCLSEPAGRPGAAPDGAPDDRLGAARRQLARLVSRDISAMNEPALRETAIETLAENLNDSVIAPLFWYTLAGLPGAVLYRFEYRRCVLGHRAQALRSSARAALAAMALSTLACLATASWA